MQAPLQVSMLFLQGTRDALAEMPLLAATVEKLGAQATLVPLEGADHAINIQSLSGRSNGEVLHEALDAIAAWVEVVLRAPAQKGTSRGADQRAEGRRSAGSASW